jgi:hypothetical protein
VQLLGLVGSNLGSLELNQNWVRIKTMFMNIRVFRRGNGPLIQFYYSNHSQNQIRNLSATRIGIGSIFFQKIVFSFNLRLRVIGFSLWLWVLGCVFGFSYFHFSCRLTIILCCVLLIVVVHHCHCFRHPLVMLMWCSFHYSNCVAWVVLMIVMVFFLLGNM